MPDPAILRLVCSGKDSTVGEGFFYVPFDDIYAAGDVTPRHMLLAIFFAPANLVDHFLFGSPEALTHAPMMRLT